MEEKNYVALFKNHEYILGEFNEAGRFNQELSTFKTLLPAVYKSEGVTKEILDGILDLGYTENGDEYTIWDKTVDSYTKLTVPVYVEVFGEYKYTKKSYTFEFPSNETIEAANKIYYKVKSAANEKTRSICSEILEKKLINGNGIAFINLEEEIPFYGESSILYYCMKNMIIADTQILWKANFLDIYVVGVISKKNAFKELQLYIPREYIGAIIGKGGYNIKDMAEKMRVNKIQVLPLEEKPED